MPSHFVKLFLQGTLTGTDSSPTAKQSDTMANANMYGRVTQAQIKLAELQADLDQFVETAQNEEEHAVKIHRAAKAEEQRALETRIDAKARHDAAKKSVSADVEDIVRRRRVREASQLLHQ